MASNLPGAEEHSTIHQAARDGNLETVQYHINRWRKKKFKLNKLDKQELSALHYAVRYGHLTVVNLLISAGADVHCLGQDGAQPIHFAARHLRLKSNPGVTSTTTISIVSDDVEGIMESIPKKKESVSSNRAFENHGLIALGPLVPSGKEESNVLQLLLENGAETNGQDIYGQTPLHYASLKGNLMATEILLKQPDVDVEIRDKSRATALHSACSSGSVEVVELLLSAGASLVCMDDENLTPFHYAVISGHLKVVQVIFDIIEKRNLEVSVEQLLIDRDRQDQNALHLAVDNGHFEIGNLILGRGASANQVRASHVTSLHIASAAGRLDLMTLLVAHGARIDTRNADGETALHKSAAFNRTDAVSYLLSRGANINANDEDSATPLIVAAANGHADVVECLLKRGAALHVKDASEKTAIYWAAEENSSATLKILLDDPRAKMLVNESERYDNTPLHIAAKKGYLDIVRILIAHNANLDAGNDEDHTPLHLAAQSGRVRVVKELLTRQPEDISEMDEAGNTPLHLAAIKGHADVIDVLVDFGASVDARNVSMWTPLDCAAAEGHLMAARCLLDRDSPLDPQDKSKTTPLHLASREGHLDVVKLLLEREADVTLTDADKKNCLDMAIESGHGAVALAILGHKDWLLALKNRYVVGEQVTTPFRKMIQKLPDVAFTVCNLLMKFSKDIPMNHNDFKVTFFYEILDDTYADWSMINDRDSIGDENSDTMSLVSTHIKKEFRLKQLEKKSNHPLFIMAQNKQEKLLNHPVVRSLLQEKWRRYGRYIYYSKLSLYVVFLFFLTAYVIVSTPILPKYVAVNGTRVCTREARKDSVVVTIFVDIGEYAVLILATIQLTMEIAQAISRRAEYLSVENLIEWFIFVLAIVYVADSIADEDFYIERCSVTHVSIGSVTIFLAWLDLLLFLRKFPKHGIYVVMFTDILNTFIQFSLTFSLFIIAFALGFYILLHQQVNAFDNSWKSLMKVMVMMIGEFDFDNIFNENRSERPPVITWILFVVFVIVMTIILMNLLVGLAVDDIKAVQDQAVLNRLKMQVDLVLDVEKVLPRKLRQRLAVTEETVYPNRESPWKRFWRPHPATVEALQRALNPERAVVEMVQQQTSALHDTVQDLKEDMTHVNKKLENMEKMMIRFLAQQQIDTEDL